MRKLFIVLAAIVCTTCQTVAQESALKGKKVLFVYGGWDGHEPKQCHDLLKPWLQEQGAIVYSYDKLDVYTDKEMMGKVDLIIQTWTMGSISGEQERGLLELASLDGTADWVIPSATIPNTSSWWADNGWLTLAARLTTM